MFRHPVRSIVLALAFAAPLLGGCSTNPATGRSQFMLLSREEEIAMGSEAAPQFTEEFGGPVADAELQEYVRTLGRKLSRKTESDFAELPWEFMLLDSSVVNAFALPGGKVFITRGLAEKLEHEAELVGVLGHEVGHVTAQHSNQQISRQVGAQVLLSGAAIAVGAAVEDESGAVAGLAIPAITIGGQLVLLKYGRDEEMEADALGMRYMSRLRFDPEGQRRVMRVLASLGRGGAPPEWLSTHPAPASRIRHIDELLATEFKDTQGNPDYALDRDRAAFERFHARLRELPPAKHGASAQGDDAASAALASGWCATCGAAHGG